MFAMLLTAIIDIERIVPGTPAEVFNLWLTRDGVRTFFAPDAVIEPRVGGEYTIVFAPEQDPEGLSHGTKGAKLLELDPGRKLVFEWISFTSREIEGVPGPPVAPPDVRMAAPLPVVEVTFEAVGTDRTKVRLRHRGFREGELWEQSRAVFSRVWPAVLEELAQRK
jgi:uncharacterized protein YndB with AHSA1/START domain